MGAYCEVGCAMSGAGAGGCFIGGAKVYGGAAEVYGGAAGSERYHHIA